MSSPSAQEISTGKLYLIVGPSGVGKGTIVDILRQRYPAWVFPISVTTRPPRAGEVSGHVYDFISDAEFQRMLTQGELLEHAVVHATRKYGTLKAPILAAIHAGRTVVREIDIQGLISVQQVLPRDFFTSIFISPPSIDIIRSRILHRQPDIDPSELQHRLDSAQAEMSQKNKADHEVTSREGDIEGTVADVVALIAHH